jgi:hypothetical protein
MLGAIALLAAVSGCENLTDGYSTDPINITDPSVISINNYLNGSQVNLIGAYEGDVSRLTGMWSGHFSGEDRQYVGLSNYVVAGRDFNTEWSTIYSGVLANNAIIRAKAKAAKNPRALGIVQVMDAMAFGLAADLWGDVPYTEALQYPVIPKPKYDSQQSVYEAVQLLLDSALQNLTVAVDKSQDPGEYDIFYKGDPALWIRAANTLKARFYLHTKDYAKAITYSDPAIAINDPSASMVAPHGNIYLQNFNLYYSFGVYDRPGYMAANNAHAPLILDPANADSRNNSKTNEEARLWYYYFVNGDGSYDLNYVSKDYMDPDPWPVTSTGFFGSSSSFPMVTYEENMLIRAEAFAKTNSAANALDALNAWRAQMALGKNLQPGYLTTEFSENWGITDDEGNPILLGHQYDPYDLADFDPGAIANPEGRPADEALLYEILEEKYISLTGQLEVFNDIRRTKNYLGIELKSGAAKFPQRLLYPQDEVNSNVENVPTANVGLYDETPVNKSAY